METGHGAWWTCPECGKLFFVSSASDWRYKRGGTYFHTWSCMRSYDAKHENELHEKRVRAAKMRHMVKPKIIVKTRASMRYCGKCGARVNLADEKCQKCGTYIDWSEYKKGDEA